MSKKKPVIVYGRKKIVTQSLPSLVPSPDIIAEKEPVVGTRHGLISNFKTASENNSDLNIKLFSESLGDTSRSPLFEVASVSVKGKKGTSKKKEAAKPKPKKEPKQATKKSKAAAKTIKPPPKQHDENTAPWAKSTVDFKEYEDYSLAVTMEKSKLDAIPTLPDAVNIIEKQEEVELLQIGVADDVAAGPPPHRFASTPAASLKASCPEKLLDSAKASPVVPSTSEDATSDEIEQVGNAKLPTPKLPPCKYALRSFTERNSCFTVSSSMTDVSKHESRRRKAVFSLHETPTVSAIDGEKSGAKSVHLQKSVRFADSVSELSHKSDPGSISTQTPKASEEDWKLPSFIECSECSDDNFLSISVTDNSSKSLDANRSAPLSKPFALPIGEVVSTTQPDYISAVMEDSLQLPSLISLGPTMSILPEELTAPLMESISHCNITEDQTEKEGTTPAPSRANPKITPIAHVSESDYFLSSLDPHNVTGESEMGDVVGDLVIAPVINKASRFANRVSVPSNVSLMNNSSRLADISMRRKSLLVHEISVDHDGESITFDDADNFAKSRLAILTPVKNRRSHLQLSPLEKLLRACGQGGMLNFEDFFTAPERKACVKIGEGVSGEVFKVSMVGLASRVIKVIPINGTVTFNDAEQKTFADILAEVVISRKTTAFAKAATILQERTPSRRTRSTKARKSTLRNSWEDDENTKNASPNFIAVNRVCVVQGYFPPFLVKLWEKFAQTKGSENDHPNRFDQSQHYLIFDSVFGGEPLENFKFTSAFQALAIFAQVAVSLAVGEAASSFEHRDLHWGNILIHNVDHEKLQYRVGSKWFAISSGGYEVSIIDFTLSRCSEDGVVVFTNLSQDEGIFMGEGDFQFEVYRLMRKECNDNWAAYTPRTNCFWLQYLLEKLLKRVVYKVARTNAAQHSDSMKVLTELFFRVQDAKSASQFVYDSLLPNAAKLLEINED